MGVKEYNSSMKYPEVNSCCRMLSHHLDFLSLHIKRRMHSYKEQSPNLTFVLLKFGME